MKSLHFFRWFVLMCWSLLTVAGFCQSIPYLHYSVAEGLPSSEVYNIMQDKKGFIWFSTDNGVVRYDGNAMDVYQTNDGLSDPVVFEIIEDSKERLWFRTFSGKLSYFQNEKIYTYKYNDALPDYCNSIYVDSTDQLWFGGGSYLGKINSEGIATKDSIPGHHIAFKTIENRLFYVCPFPSLIDTVTFNGRNIQIDIGREKKTTWELVYSLIWNGDRIFSFGACLFKIIDEKAELVYRGVDQIISLSLDRNNALWIGHLKSDIECLADFKTKKKLDLDFLMSKSVTRVLQDNQGGYWFSTLQDGVFYVPHINFRIHHLPVHTKLTSAISFGEKGLVGDDKGQILLIDKNGKVRKRAEFKSRVLSIIKAKNNTFWATTYKTFIFDTSLLVKKMTPYLYSGLSSDSAGTYWGVSGHSIYNFDFNGRRSWFYSRNPHRQIYCSGKFIFLFGRRGLEMYSPQGKKTNLPSAFESLKVTDIHSLNDSILLVTTLGSGFFVVNQKRWADYQQYSSTHFFITNNVYSILKVGTNLWLGTNKGVAVAPIQSILEGSPQFSFYSKKNGMVGDKINFLTYNDRHIWAFGENSFCSVPEDARPDDHPLFFVQNILINNKPSAIGKNQKFANDQNNIQVNFKLIDFRNQNIFIRSRLSPNDTWNYSQDRNVKFYSLKSNDYALEIEYSLDNVHWNRVAVWNFTILPPWWRTWYFQLSLVASVLAVGAVYYRNRISRLKEKHNYLKIINEQQENLIRAELQALERERSRIAKELHDSVGTNLSAIKMTVRRLLTKHEEPKADLVEDELQNTIQEIKDIIYKLIPSGLSMYGLTATLRSYTQKIHENLGLDIEVHSYGSDTKEPDINLTSFRIIQELLSNSLKYAQAKKILIHINYFDDILNIIYEDDGIGFNMESVKKGSGLLNIQSRVQTAGGTLRFDSGSFGVSYTIDLPTKKTSP